MNINILKDLKETRTNYRGMIEFCCDSLILNNDIVNSLQMKGFDFEIYAGDYKRFEDEEGNEITEEEANERNDEGLYFYEYFDEIYQYYIISSHDAERLKEYTNELVMFNSELDLFVLCVTHWGTSWDGVPANWKE